MAPYVQVALIIRGFAICRFDYFRTRKQGITAKNKEKTEFQTNLTVDLVFVDSNFFLERRPRETYTLKVAYNNYGFNNNGYNEFTIMMVWTFFTTAKKSK